MERDSMTPKLPLLPDVLRLARALAGAHVPTTEEEGSYDDLRGGLAPVMFNPATFDRRIRDAFSALHLAMIAFGSCSNSGSVSFADKKVTSIQMCSSRRLPCNSKGHVCDISLYIYMYIYGC